MTLMNLLDEIAARTPAPGGGAVASCVGALTASLGCMALRYSISSKTPDERRRRLEDEITAIEAHGHRLLALAEEDAAAYSEMNALQRLPEDDPGRRAGWDAAVHRAISAPLTVMEEGHRMVSRLHMMYDLCNRRLRSDLAIAALLGKATVESAAWNVRVNLAEVADESSRGEIAARLEWLITESQFLAEMIDVRAREGEG